VRSEWFDVGTSFLFRHMLLFFVPAAVGAMQYPQLFGTEGLRVLAVVGASTVLVMVATAFAVEWSVARESSKP
jgi:holin-like protein